MITETTDQSFHRIPGATMTSQPFAPPTQLLFGGDYNPPEQWPPGRSGPRTWS